MDITYNYEIFAVNEDAGVMEIVYTADGHPTQHIGARLPADGELLEDVIKAYAPVNFWIELSVKRQSVAVGLSGTIEAVDTVLDPAAVTRAERDALLAGTDIYGLSDMTMTPEMLAYRQALRDITSQAGFPESIDWPTKP